METQVSGRYNLKNMIYAMSDRHGMYDKYIKMLELIKFSDNDELYVLGDVIDRGDKSVEILLDMMKRPNVNPIIGNHELMALTVLDVMFKGENGESSVPVEALIGDWLINGGGATLEGIAKLTNEQRLDVIDYLSDFTLFETVDVGDKTFIMVHAGFDNFSREKKLSDYTVNDLVWHRPDPAFIYFMDNSINVVVGHTPTKMINGGNSIVRRRGNIFIDCGACQEGGRLACLCFDTMEEFYT